MQSKFEDNIKKQVKHGVMSPDWFKKKKYRITCTDGRQEEFSTAKTTRKYAADAVKI